MENKNKADIDGDGIVSEEEKKIAIERIEHNEKMAWIAFGAIIAVGFYTAFFASVEQLAGYGNSLDWFYIACSSVIGIYYGQDWFSKK